MARVLLVVVFGLAAVCQCKHAKQAGDVVFATVLFRHGDRAPIVPYPTDPYDQSYWPNGWSQLTELGKRQAFRLGHWLRDRYSDLLPLRYMPRDIHAESTDVDRTLMTAQCVLAGLYQPAPGHNWHPTIGWTPVPVHTAPDRVDRVLMAGAPCPQHEAKFREVFASEDMIMRAKYKTILQEISGFAGRNYRTVYELIDMYSTLLAEDLHGLKLPSWTTAYYPQPLHDISVWAFRLQCLTPPMRRLKCGPLVKTIVDRMKLKRDGAVKQKLWLYSGHDMTIVNLLSCLGVFDDSLPEYSSAVVVELLATRDQQHTVAVSFSNSTGTHRLAVPGCGFVCPLDVFEAALKPVIPLDIERECRGQ